MCSHFLAERNPLWKSQILICFIVSLAFPFLFSFHHLRPCGHEAASVQLNLLSLLITGNFLCEVFKQLPLLIGISLSLSWMLRHEESMTHLNLLLKCFLCFCCELNFCFNFVFRLKILARYSMDLKTRRS